MKSVSWRACAECRYLPCAHLRAHNALARGMMGLGVRVGVGTTRGTLNVVIVAWRLPRLHVGVKVVPEQLEVTPVRARSPCAFSCADRATAMCHWVKAPALPVSFARRIPMRPSARYSCTMIPMWKLTVSSVYYPLAVGRLPWCRGRVFRPPRDFGDSLVTSGHRFGPPGPPVPPVCLHL
jgi:hypothetical protein